MPRKHIETITIEGDNAKQEAVKLRAFVEVDRATMGPERLAAKVGAYARLYFHTPAPAVRRRLAGQEPPQEEWRRRYPLFSPGCCSSWTAPAPPASQPASAPSRAAAGDVGLAGFLNTVPVLAVPLTDLLQHGPSAPIWHPIHTPDQDQDRKVGWTQSPHH